MGFAHSVEGSLIKSVFPQLTGLLVPVRLSQAEIVDARNDPDALASFKALRLNLGVADIDRAVLLDAGAWKRAAGLPEPEPSRGGYVLGVDLGTSAAMSAAAAYHRSGWLDAVAVFPNGRTFAAVD